MIHASFHERLWDLQQRKAGAERLRAREEFERVWRKLQLNSSYGKMGYQPIDERIPNFVKVQREIMEGLLAQKFELIRLAREFRPF